MRCQVVTLAIFAAACLAGLSAATYTSPDFSYFVGSKSVAYWRSDCYDPSVDSDLQITGGWRMLVSAAFTPPNKVDLQFHGYLGVTCTSASAVDVTAAVTITGQDNSTLPSYIKWKYTLDKFIVNFQNALVRDRWRDAFATSSCNIDTFTPKDIAVSGCGDFLASQQNCPTRYIGFHTLSSSSMQFGYWFSQTNVQDGCSDPTIAANFTYAPYFQPSNGTTPPQLSLSMVTSNANPSFAKPGDSVTLTIVSDKTLLTAPFATLFGTELQATQTAAKTYTASWTLGSSTPQTDVTQNVRVNNYADTDFNPGSQVLGCAGCLPITFDKTPPALSTWSYSVDGLSGEAGARFIFEGQALVVRIKAVDATYKSTSPTSVRVTVTNSSGTAFNYDATLVLVADDNTATFQWIAVGSVTGTVTVTVQNVFDPAGNSIEPVTADSGNSAAPLDLKLVAKYPLVSSIAIDASDYTKLVVTYSCSQAGTAYFSFVPDRRDSTTVSNFLNTYSTVSAFRSQTQYPVKEFPCLTTSQITEVTIVNGGAINQKSWYTVVYVSTSTGGDSPAPSVLLDVYTAAKYCFSADSTVALEDGSSRAMSQLQIGDRVLSFDEATGRTEYSDVAYIHKHAETAMFLRVSTRAGSQLTITPNHNIFRVSAENARELVKASELLVGDRVIVAGESGTEPAEIAKIDWTIEDKSFSPITLNGRMFVDGVLVSCYGANGETLGHLSHLPHRLLYRVAPSVLSSPSALRFQDAVVTAYHGLITAQVSH